MASLTARVKEELAVARCTRPQARAAELAALIRYGGEISIAQGQPVIDIEVDTEAIATRAETFFRELFDATPSITTPGPSSTSRDGRYVLHLDDGTTDIIRRLGLVTRSGHLVVGLPPHIVSGTVVEIEAALRGAFLASGQLADPARSTALEIAAPCTLAASALVGGARRLNVNAKAKETRGVVKVVVKDGTDIGVLLARLGAHLTRLQWDEERIKREDQASANRLANFDDANLRRSVRAAVAAAAKVERAMEILGDDVPEHLVEAGTLRIKHRQESLEELGRLADPPMTKDAVAGRIRRLLTMADKKAAEIGVPPTSEAVVEENLEDI
ncbi:MULTISPECIES: DNA-binding protein WhiA [unclassified Corynebacterium]|uniref:DNA-binding protein WhiA n=1 Tax=unclassified Corynebacterium TaxID=2624378 RepID=UPI00124E96DF|nr:MULTISPECIES: DNA-binding protein WhiA [unclassified Corynebacterium]